MRRFASVTLLLAALATGGFAQQWEFGGLGGGSFLSHVNVTAPAGSATAGFQTGYAVGGFFGENLYRHLSGEFRYVYLESDLHISSGGVNPVFSGDSHLLNYDLLYHTNREGSRVQVFVAAGGGLRIFRGTGTEEAYQPNYQFGYLTKTQQLKPMADIGGGLRFQLSRNVYLRAELRDYITPFPNQIIAPAPGAKFGSILNTIVPMVSLSYEK